MIHNDEPVLADALERAGLVREIGDAAAGGDPPLVFGIHGDWGLGKTSLLHQIHYYLSGECPHQTDAQRKAAKKVGIPLADEETRSRVRIIWFEAWRYQNENVPVVALLHEVRAQLAWYQNVARNLKKTLSVTARGALLSLEDVTKKIGFQAAKVEQAGREWEQEHLASSMPSNTIREHLKEAIDQLLPKSRGQPKARLVVLIDDLDRCEPEAAYRLLEGLKIYLTLSNCVFILGMNQQIVEDAIGKHVPAGDPVRKKERAGAYLEKLCQNIWRLPAVQNPKTYLLALLPGTMYRGWVDQALTDLNCLPPNPRRIKGLANLLLRFEDRLPARIGGPDENQLLATRLMLIVALIYQFHHELYLRWESHPAFYDAVRDWCFGGKPRRTPAVDTPEETGKPPPQPSDPVDLLFYRLRPVEWITRDTQTATPKHYQRENAFPDPADTNVFWAQPLIVQVEEDSREAARQIKGDDFRPYLRLTVPGKKV